MSCVISHSRYTDYVAPVKRDRDWSPVAISATKAAVTAMVCGFVVRAPFYGGSTGRRKPGRFLARGCPVDQPVELPPRLVSEWWFHNRNLLEASMATPLSASAPTLTTPHIVSGLSLTDPRCAEVLNALPGMADPAPATPIPADRLQSVLGAYNAANLASSYIERGNFIAARRKLTLALAAINQLTAEA